jgi:hypothetical protein
MIEALALKRTSKLLRTSTVVHMSSIVVLFHTLSLSRSCAIRNSLGEKGHELANRTLLVERKGGEISSVAENRAWSRRRGMYDRNGVDLHRCCKGHPAVRSRSTSTTRRTQPRRYTKDISVTICHVLKYITCPPPKSTKDVLYGWSSLLRVGQFFEIPLDLGSKSRTSL